MPTRWLNDYARGSAFGNWRGLKRRLYFNEERKTSARSEYFRVRPNSEMGALDRLLRFDTR